MGDVAMVVPVVGALRAAYPQAEITVLTRTLFRSFFDGVDDIKFADFDPSGRHEGMMGLYQLSKELGRFDLVADMHDVVRTKVLRRLLWLKGAKVKHIDKGRSEKKQLTRAKNKVFKPLTATIERYRNVLLELGLEVSMPTPYPRNPRELSDSVLEVCGAREDGEKWVGIAPFAQHSGKIYPLELLFEVAQKLSKQGSTKLFIFGGGQNEAAIAQEWQGKLGNTVSIIGRLKIPQELDLISNLDTMICMDSSSMHMASLVGTQVVSIWGATHPYAGFMGFGQSTSNAIGLNLECRPCSVYGNKPCIHGNYQCMNEIDPMVVVEKVNSLIK